MNPMKTLINYFFMILSAILLLTNLSCKKSETNSKNNISEIKNDSPYLDESIVKIIKDSIVTESNSEEGIEVSVDENKNSLMITTVLGGFETTYEEFSKLKKNNLFGDLDGDGKDEVIVVVHTDGGRPNIQFYQMYIFRQKEDHKWDLITSNTLFEGIIQKNPDDICSAVLVPYEIKNGLLKASMTCLGNGDANCCPSLEYDVTLKLENNRLVFVKKELNKSK